MQNLEEFQNIQYMPGFGNYFISETKKGIIPENQNNPQKCPQGLFCQQLNGSAFTTPRFNNQRTWFYKLRPSVTHSSYSPYKSNIVSSFNNQLQLNYFPDQLRFKAIPFPKQGQQVDFVDGLVSVCGAGEPSLKSGIAIYVYSANKSMKKKSFYNSDGDLLIVPQKGQLFIKTQFGNMTVKPRQICVIQRGIKFSVFLKQSSRGWVAQIFKSHFKIPDLGPIGANGLANPKHFMHPTAKFQNIQQKWLIVNKYLGKLFSCQKNHSLYDIVGWSGNYVPYKYNLDLFNTMNSVSYDHPDPSIFTVLTAQSDQIGTAVLDFVIFPPRWMVAEHTFRPPYYHRNCMSQFMGNIQGIYDAKEGGFGEAYSSLHSIMTAHGPDYEGFIKGSEQELKPVKYQYQNLSFMFQSSYMLKTTKICFDFLEMDKEYLKCWQKLGEMNLLDKK